MNNKANYNVNLENINFQNYFGGFINNSQNKLFCTSLASFL